MSATSILIKTDSKIKQEAQKTAKEMGLSLSAALNALLKQFIHTKTITFSRFNDEEPSEYFKRELKQALKDREEGKASPIFHSADEAIKWLEQQGI